MRDFKKRRSGREEILHLGLRVLGVLALLGVTTLAVRGTWGMYVKMASASEAQQQAEAQLGALQDQEQGVQVSLAELSSVRGVEQEVRERFGVAKPGEGQIDIVREDAATTSAQAPQEGWVTRLVRALFAW